MSDAQSGSPLTSVSVCLLSAPATCTTTDGSGAFSLSGVQGAADGFRGSLASYVTGIWPESPTGTTTFNVELRPTTLIASLAKAAGATWDGTTGAVLFFVEDGSGNGLPGAHVTLSTGGKIAYFNTNGSLDGQLAATTTNGSGYVFELAAGATNISVTVMGKTCGRAGADGWTPTVSGAVLAGPIVIGQLTKFHVACQ
jgi:hypothetical protein